MVEESYKYLFGSPPHSGTTAVGGLESVLHCDTVLWALSAVLISDSKQIPNRVIVCWAQCP